MTIPLTHGSPNWEQVVPLKQNQGTKQGA